MLDLSGRRGKPQRMGEKVPLSKPARAIAALIAAAALGGQVIQTYMDALEGMPIAESLWRQLRYFTVWMAFTVAATYGLMALRNRHVNKLWSAALTTWIVMVGIIYQALLAADHNPVGILAVTNEIQHTIVPLAVLLFWAFHIPKAGLTFLNALSWIICPLIYAVYATVRGIFDGRFPYFFLNPEVTGWLGVGAYVLGLGALFFIAGALLVLFSRALSRG